MSLVSTYVVCERLSVMQRQARLPEVFDQIAHFTPKMKFGSRSHSPSEIETQTFYSEFKSDLFHNSTTPPPPTN